MAKKLIRLLVIAAAFLISAALTGAFLNQGNADMTGEMPPATLPAVHIISWGEEFAPLFGLMLSEDNDVTAERNAALGSYRPGIAVAGCDRVVNFVADRFGNRILSVEYELRSRDGQRLIEKGEILDTREEEGRLYGSVALKDLIEMEQEYIFSVILNTSGSLPVKYTTPLLFSDSMNVFEKCEFVRSFHDATMDRDRAQEITRYLEPDSTGDNSTFAKVNIHSGLKQVFWEGLDPRESTPPRMTIREIARDTASMTMNYRVSMMIDGENTEYNVEESYRIRYSPERMYLLDFERECRRIFDAGEKVYGDRTISFGITTKSAVDLKESDDGNIIAFVNENRLFVFNQVTGRISEVYSVCDPEHRDLRYLHDDYGVKVLSLEETGNCLFLVHGYMNRGAHEGNVGILIMYFDAGVNTVEEQAFIPYERSPEELAVNMGRLLHYSRAGDIIFLLDGVIYTFNLESRQLAPVLGGENLRIAGDQDYIVTSEGDPELTETLVITDLTDFSEHRIYADSGSYIKPLGFMGGDFIYGLAKREDVDRLEEEEKGAGETAFPMYELRIQTPQGTLLASYSEPGIYITGIRIEENQIMLERASLQEDGSLIPVAEDQITNAALSRTTANHLETVLTEEYETIIQLVLKQEIDPGSVMVLTPREVLFEGSRVSARSGDFAEQRYLAYDTKGLIDFYDTPSKAFLAAYEASGSAATERGDYIYRRTSTAVKNQIMAIRQVESEDPMAACLDAILSFEGGTGDAGLLLERGKTPEEILTEGLSHARVLDLTGCPLKAMEYFLDQDIPVMVIAGEEALLLTGFNETEYVVLDPLRGTLGKQKKTLLETQFEETGNWFLTYVRTQG